MEILYTIFNRSTCEVKTVEQRIGELQLARRDTDITVPVSLKSVLAPDSIDLTHGSYVVMDGVYHAYLIVPSDGYNPRVVAGWTSILVNAGEGIDVDFYFFREPKERIQAKLGQQIRINRSRLKDTSDTNSDFDDFESAIRSGYFLKEGLANYEDFYYCNTLVTITADTLENLEWRISEVRRLMVSQDMDIRICRFHQEQALLSILPICSLNKKLFEASKRNMLTSAAASCYPFTSFEMSDENGILLGVNQHNNSLVIVDIFNSRVYKNANMVLLGTSGAGKTFTLQLIALRMRRKGTQVFIIAPLKGHEFLRACNNIGGEFISISPASKQCINVCEIRKQDLSANQLIDGVISENSILAKKIQQLHIFFSLLIPDISHEERQLLDEALIRTYAKKGITHNNESLIDPEHPDRYREMPLLGDIYEILMESPETRRMGTGDPIKGAKFNVTFRSDKTSTGEIRDLGTYYSDENGQFFIDKLDDGWYTITELEPAAGYSIKDPTSQQVYVEAGRGKVVTFENTPLSAIIVKKVDSSTGDPLQGAWFRVRFLGGTSGTGGTVIAERQTSSNGTFILTGLKAGTYVIEEISAPDGYVLSENDIQTVYLSGNEQDVITVTFGNEAKGSVLIKKIDAITREPLSDVEFMVTESNGTVVGNRNGKYVTDSVGTILIDGLDPNTTLVIKEVRAKSGYVLDDTPQTVKVRSHEVVTVEFRNQPLGGLRIVKLDSVTRKPLAGVEFRVAYADGSYVPDEGGKLSSNGIYRTDENGEILISGIVGTLVVTETKTISGYVIDEETRSQTVVIDPDDLQTLTFYNRPAGGLQIIKSDEDTGARIKGVKFEVRKINGEILGTYTTDRNGVISIPNAENGWYTITELKAAEGYELDATPVNVCVKDGETTTVEITNQRMASIMIHKVDAATGEGIYGVKFVLYDAGKNPIGEYATDQDGYIYIDDELTPGKYYIRELEAAEGYIRDEQYKTVYVEAGKCAQIEWENSAVTGQIQVRKYSADDNLVTGQRAGSALEGAVFEITQARSGKVVGYIVTDARGVAASDPLPLGRYFVTEVSAPKYYQLSSEKMEAEIEYPNQIIKLSAYNKSANLGVTIKKTGNREVQPGQVMSYDFSGIGNTSNVALNSFFWHDRIATDATRAISVTTGTYNARLYYKVTFKTNLSDYRTLASNLLTSNNYSLSLNAATLGLAQGEYVTDVRFEFGTVPSGFASVVKPTMRVQVLGTVSNGYQIINRADVGGQYLNEWQTTKATWVTTVCRFNNNPLPKTGY